MGQPQRPHTRRVERDVMRAVWRHLGHSILMELLAIGAALAQSRAVSQSSTS